MNRGLRRTDWEGYNLGNTDPHQRGLDHWRHRRRLDRRTLITIIVGLIWCLAILADVVFVVLPTTKN